MLPFFDTMSTNWCTTCSTDNVCVALLTGTGTSPSTHLVFPFAAVIAEGESNSSAGLPADDDDDDDSSLPFQERFSGNLPLEGGLGSHYGVLGRAEIANPHRVVVAVRKEAICRP
jgi:hypothetical protein